MSSKRVAILWDYENCRPPANIPGFAVVRRLRQLVQSFGSITLFKAYADLANESVNPRAAALQSELQSSGVSLTNCPHNGRKDVADKMILVDMLAFAMDNSDPSSTTIALISGDRDFAYAVSVLRHRGYSVVLFVPVSCHASLRVQASRVIEWRDIFSAALPRATKDAKETTNDTSSAAAGDTQSRDPVALLERIAWVEDDATSVPSGHNALVMNTPKTPSHRRSLSNSTTPFSPQRNANRTPSATRKNGTRDNRRYQASRVPDLNNESTNEAAPFGCNNDTFGPVLVPTDSATKRNNHDSPFVVNDPKSVSSESLVQTPALFAGAAIFCCDNDDDDEVEAETYADEYEEDVEDSAPNDDETWSVESRATSVSIAVSLSDDSPPRSDFCMSIVGEDGQQRRVSSEIELVTTYEDESSDNALTEASEEMQKLAFVQRTEQARTLLFPFGGREDQHDGDHESHTEEEDIHQRTQAQSLSQVDICADVRVSSQSVCGWEEYQRDRLGNLRHGDDEFIPDYGDEFEDIGQPFVERLQAGSRAAGVHNEREEDDGAGEADMSQSSDNDSQGDVSGQCEHPEEVKINSNHHFSGVEEQTRLSTTVSSKLPLTSRISGSSTSTLKPWVNPFTPFISSPMFAAIQQEGQHFHTVLSSSSNVPASTRSCNPPAASCSFSQASVLRFSTLISVLRSHQESTGAEFMKSALLGSTLTKRDPNVYIREAAFDAVYESPEDSTPLHGANLQARLSKARYPPVPIKLKEYICRAQQAGVVVLDRSEGWSNCGSVGVGLASGVVKRYEVMNGKQKESNSVSNREHDELLGSRLGDHTLEPGGDVVATRDVIQHRGTIANASAPSSHTSIGLAKCSHNLTDVRLQATPSGSGPASYGRRDVSSHQLSSVSPSSGSTTTTSSASQITTSSSETSSLLTPTFAPMVSVLLQIHTPTHRVPRKAFAIRLLKQFPDVYDREGIQGDRKFRSYVDMAERAGVVRTGGEGKQGWIELAEGWATTDR